MWVFSASIIMGILLVAPAAGAWSLGDIVIVYQCTGATQGNLNSGETAVVKGSDWGEAHAYREAAQISMNQDASSPGTRQHAGVYIVRYRSRSTPRYLRALVQTEQLQCTFEWWEYSATGPEKTFTISLTNARVESYEAHDATQGPPTETLSFRAEQVTWTHHPSSTTFTDNLAAAPP
jgi:type VI secretion system Hcp family effector